MEVHHHPHVEKKNFKEYFLEFLMIFLAVTMGFFAENIREHISENSQAKELAKSFYEELKSDSAKMNTAIENRSRRDSALNYLKLFYTDSSISKCSKDFAINFYYTYATFNLSIFDPNDAILQQLKNSGSLRYFRSIELQKLTDNLSVKINYVRARNQSEWTYFNEHLIPFLESHNDQTVLDFFQKDNKVRFVDAMRQFQKSNETIVFHFKKPETFDKVEALNNIGFYQLITRATSEITYSDYSMLNHQLLDALRKEYDLKDE